MEFRFDADEVYIRRDAGTGDVILSIRPGGDWQSFMELREQLGTLPADFLAPEKQGQEQRDPFEGWAE
ncbi:MAG: AbrB/MazE/SpoVT family DNA-binding domain-containing protein [Proteobacteria bacterium]|nr:AbrB/MazE/SpoVT family DNA-binding domain-containing protein [Pseudomonadota bacterium]